MNMKIAFMTGKNADKGYTLVEVLMAMTILTMGLLAIGAMQIGAIKGNISARKKNQATNLATAAMEKVISIPYNHSDLNPGVHNWEDANIGNEFEVYWEVTDGPISKTVNVQVVVSYEDRGETRYKTLNFIKSNDVVEDIAGSGGEDAETEF